MISLTEALLAAGLGLGYSFMMITIAYVMITKKFPVVVFKLAGKLILATLYLTLVAVHLVILIAYGRMLSDFAQLYVTGHTTNFLWFFGDVFFNPSKPKDGILPYSLTGLILLALMGFANVHLWGIDAKKVYKLLVRYGKPQVVKILKMKALEMTTLSIYLTWVGVAVGILSEVFFNTGTYSLFTLVPGSVMLVLSFRKAMKEGEKK